MMDLDQSLEQKRRDSHCAIASFGLSFNVAITLDSI